MGIGRRSVVRIETEPGEGELGHVAAPDRNEAGGAQARDARRVALGGLRPRSAIEPAVVTSPAISNRSLIETGMPANGDGAAPRARSRS